MPATAVLGCFDGVLFAYLFVRRVAILSTEKTFSLDYHCH